MPHGSCLALPGIAQMAKREGKFPNFKEISYPGRWHSETLLADEF